MDEFELETQGEEAEDESSVGGINITPLVDVALTLVLVFLVTMPLSALHGITVRRETMARYGITVPTENVSTHLTVKGVYISDRSGKEKLIQPQDVELVVSEAIRTSTGKRLFLRCERNVTQGETVRVMDIAKQSGAKDISLMEGKR